MEKIKRNILGVWCWMSALSCSAAEKFDVLPDLPELMQSASASTVGVKDSNTASLTTQTIGHEPNFITVIISLAIVILLIYITGLIFQKLNKLGYNTLKSQQGDFSKSHVAVVSTTALGNNKTLHVVELDGKRMLIGASNSTIQLIKDLGAVNTENEECDYSRIEIPNIKIPKIEIPKIEIPTINFAKILTKTHKKYEINNEDSESTAEENNDFTNKFNEENSDNIIDSLFAGENLHSEETEEKIANEHSVDPDDYALYKKYLS